MKFKNLLLIFLMFLLVSWMPTKYYYFHKETTEYQYCLDSLSAQYNLNLPQVNTWDSVKYFTNENKITTMYSIHGNRNDSTFVFSVFNNNGESYNIRMRIEIGK